MAAPASRRLTLVLHRRQFRIDDVFDHRMSQLRSGPPFTWKGVRAGAIGGLVLLPGVAMYGVAFGILADATGLSALEAILFSAWAYAGGAQLATLQAWGDPVPLVAVCLTALAMNSRYFLLGAALRPWLAGLPAHKTYASLFVLGDSNWALALREYAANRIDAGFLLGSGLMMWVTWVASTAAGHVFGQVMGRPEHFGIDFMLAAFFATMAVAFVRKPHDLWPLLAGVAVAVIVDRLVAGPWYIISGALAGSFVGMALHGRSS
jgi:4-azaleucine resistance transporter AzlC